MRLSFVVVLSRYDLLRRSRPTGALLRRDSRLISFLDFQVPSTWGRVEHLIASKTSKDREDRTFIYLSRSDTGEPQARNLAGDLKSAGATVNVIKGNVSLMEYVKVAMTAAIQLGPFKRVFQAATGVSVSMSKIL